MLDQPRTSNRSKAKDKRVSAPTTLLSSQVKEFSAKSESSGGNNNNNNNNNNNKAESNDLFDLFTSNTGSSGGQKKNGDVIEEKEGKTQKPTLNPRDSVNTQITQGLFDILGQSNNNNNNNTNNSSGADDKRISNDFDSFFDFIDNNNNNNSKSTNNNSTKNSAGPSIIQTQLGTGLKVIDEGKVASPVEGGGGEKETLKEVLGYDNDKDSDYDDEGEEEGEEGNNGNDEDKGKKAAEKLVNQGIKNIAQSSDSSRTSQTTDGKSTSTPKQTDALIEMRRGTPLLKYPRRRGFPHFKYVQISKDNTTVQYFSRKKKLESTRIFIKDIKEVLKGQETQVFRKFQQAALEKASFSIVFGHDYKSLDLVAKSVDECDLWVLGLKQLVELHKKGTDLTKLRELIVPVNFKDRNRPQSRQGSGKFVRANESNEKRVDSQELREVRKEMADLKKTFDRVKQLSQHPGVTRSEESDNVRLILSELEERLEELQQEVSTTRDTEMSKRDIWRASVDLQAIEEKIDVIAESSQKGKRRSNFW